MAVSTAAAAEHGTIASVSYVYPKIGGLFVFEKYKQCRGAVPVELHTAKCF
jgi:hypothetical protein